MNINNFFQGQLVSEVELNKIDNFRVASDQEVVQSLLGKAAGYGKGISYFTGSIFRGGVIGAPIAVDSLVDIDALKPEAIATDSIAIYPGSAIDASGNILSIANSAVIHIAEGSADKLWEIDYNKLHYIYLTSYLSGSVIQTDDVGASFYTQYTLRPKLVVSSNNPGSTVVLLGTFISSNTTGEIVTGTLIDRRQFAGGRTSADRIYIDPTENPLSGSVNTVHEHINAVGTGTASIVNPHGMRVYDLTGGIFETHSQQLHANGIILQDTQNVIYKDSYKAVLTGYEYPSDSGQYSGITCTVPVGATASIQGRFYTGSLAASFNSDSFTGSVTGEIYYVVLQPNSTKTNVEIQLLSSAEFQHSSKLRENILIATVIPVHEVGPEQTFFHTLVDIREIGTVKLSDLQVDLVEGTSSPLVDISPTGSVLTNLDRIRYQLGNIIEGDPVSWRGSLRIYSSVNEISEAVDNLYNLRDRSGSSTFLIRPDLGEGMLDYSELQFNNNLYPYSDRPAGLRFNGGNSRFELYIPVTSASFDRKFGSLYLNEVTFVNNVTAATETLTYEDVNALKALILPAVQ